MDNEPKSFLELLKEKKVTIPSFQRDYAQGRAGEENIRKTFLSSIKKCLDGPLGKPMILNFIYGGKSKEQGVFTPLDGQQRLTTLFLLHVYAKNREDGRNPEGSELLNRFSYDTRISSREFCTSLAKENIDLNETPSSYLAKQVWFSYGWDNDPSVKSMLNTLDDIVAIFKDVDNIWNKLAIEKRIVFYFLEEDALHANQDLYIKMNARGKQLSELEIFKAAFLEYLEAEMSYSKGDILEISLKFDNEWDDIFWKYCADLDDKRPEILFKNYLVYLFDIINIKRHNDRLKDTSHLNYVFRTWKEDGESSLEEKKEDIDFIIDSLNAWVGEEPSSFFDKFVYSGSDNFEKDKIKSPENSNDLLLPIIFSSSPSVAEMFRLYGFLIYKKNIDEIDEKDFRKRLRALNNLILNSSDEMTVRTRRGEREKTISALNKIVTSTESLIKEGIASGNIKGFNSRQIEEEKKKEDLYETLISDLAKLEDHPFFNGSVDVFEVEKLKQNKEYARCFLDNFPDDGRCDYKEKLSLALMSSCSPEEAGVLGYLKNAGSTYFMGDLGQGSFDNWRSLFAHCKNEDANERTRRHLISLLDLLAREPIEEIPDNFLKACKEGQTMSFPYYFVKYPEYFRRRGWHLYKFEAGEDCFSKALLLKGKVRAQSGDCLPFLEALEAEGNVDTANYQITLKDGRKIKLEKDGYKVLDKDNNEIDNIKVDMNDGFDKEDRIEKMKEWLRKFFLILMS